jgi:hypothetical protein
MRILYVILYVVRLAMRTSRKKTTLSALRAFLGIKDDEMATIADCSKFTLHSIESGRLRLTEARAERISHETGVSLKWLLDGKPKAPIVTDAERMTWESRPRWVQEPYTLEIYHRARAKKELPESKELKSVYALEFYRQIRMLLDRVTPKGDADLAIYRLDRALNEIAREFGLPESGAINFQDLVKQVDRFFKADLTVVRRLIAS